MVSVRRGIHGGIEGINRRLRCFGSPHAVGPAGRDKLVEGLQSRGRLRGSGQMQSRRLVVSEHSPRKASDGRGRRERKGGFVRSSMFPWSWNGPNGELSTANNQRATAEESGMCPRSPLGLTGRKQRDGHNGAGKYSTDLEIGET
jgi:hypothetical protein